MKSPSVKQTTSFMQPGPLPALGIDLGGTKIAAVLLDAEGREFWRQRWPTPPGDYHGTLGALAAAVQAARHAAGGHEASGLFHAWRLHVLPRMKQTTRSAACAA